jgi:hypothetical protein
VRPIFRAAPPKARPAPPPRREPREKKPAKAAKKAKVEPSAPLVLPEIPDLEVPDAIPPQKTSWPAIGATTRFVDLAAREGVLHHLHAAAERHGVPVFAVVGPSRDARFVRARREAVWRLHALAGFSSVRIGEILGGRDHTTILHHLRTFKPSADLLALLPGKEAA